MPTGMNVSLSESEREGSGSEENADEARIQNSGGLPGERAPAPPPEISSCLWAPVLPAESVFSFHVYR